MSAVQMGEAFKEALRAALLEQVRTRGTPSRRRRLRILTLATAGPVILGAGWAAASQHMHLPGADVVDHVAQSVSNEYVGSAVVELGEPPAGANSIDLSLTCLTPGTFKFAGGAALLCGEADAGWQTAGYRLPLAPGQRTTTIDTEASSRWRLTATYSTSRTTEWGVNASGQTYGVINNQGSPDLVAVHAISGKDGYVYASDLEEPPPANPQEALARQDGPHSNRAVPVFKEDGKTVVGQFILYDRPIVPGK